MKRLLAAAGLALTLGCGPVKAQGTINIALQQQFSFAGCTTGGGVGGIACGQPMLNCQLFIFVAGTVSTQQLAFQDTGLTTPLPWPVQCDGNARLPMFYLANGSVHIRLTDASGVVQYDNPSVLVVGPAGGGGGGGGVDPSTLAATGDVKWRSSTEVLSGWVKQNGTTIGSAASGATQRANADTQALFVWLWTNCTNAHCPVSSGRGATGLADFNANKTMTLPDCRARVCGVGLDDMGTSAAGRLQALNVTSGGGDGVTTSGAWGGEAVHSLVLAELPAYTPSGSISASGSVTPTGTVATTTTVGGGNVLGVTNGSGAAAAQVGSGSPSYYASSGGAYVLIGASSASTFTGNVNAVGVSASFSGNAQGGTATAAGRMPPFMLGTWYIKL